MITVARMKQLLQDLPDDFALNAYEGEETGIVVRNQRGTQVAFIHASEDKDIETKVEGILAD